MARGVISTVLGGLAGGFEGLAARQQRQRAEEERERDRQERLALQEAQMRNLDLANTLRAYESGASLTPARRTDAVSRALADAPSTVRSGQMAMDAQAARPLADATRSDFDISRAVLPESALRGEFARQPVDLGRDDPDLYEVQYGDRSFRLPSQAALTRQRDAAINRETELIEQENRGYYNLMRQQGYNVGEFEPTIPYASLYDFESRRQLAIAGRAPARPEPTQPTQVDRGIEAIQKYLTDAYTEGLGATDVYGPAISIGRAFGVPEDLTRSLLGLAVGGGGEGAGGGEEPEAGPYVAPGIAVRERRREAAEARSEREQAEISRLEENLRQYNDAIAANPGDRELIGIRARTIINLNRYDPNRYPVDARTIREAERGAF